MAVDIFAQPGQQAAELALFDLPLQVGEVAADLFPQLDGDEVAEGVGGEVADHPAGPVDILHHAIGVAGRGQAEEILHALVPGGGQVFDLQAAFHQGNFKLQPQHDMQVVGGLIGFDPDQRGLDAVDGAVEIQQSDMAELIGEVGLQARVKEFPEGQRAPDQVFPHARLAFMHGHGCAIA